MHPNPFVKFNKAVEPWDLYGSCPSTVSFWNLQSLGCLSQGLTATEAKYGDPGRELLASYNVIMNFPKQSRVDFVVITGHKHLT